MSEDRGFSPPTIHDVAARAGVSISTVSQAFSGRRPIAAATRERVQRAAEALGYNPNPAARSLRTGRHRMLGIVLRPRDAAHGSLGGTETFNRLLGAVATSTLDQGLALVHVPDLRDPTAAAVPMDGCIVANPYADDPVITELLRRDVPFVNVDRDPGRPDLSWTVAADHRAAAREILEGLHVRGSRRVLVITGTEDNAWNRELGDAHDVWCAEHGVVPQRLALYEGEAAAGAERLAREVLAGPDRPDAVIAAASRFGPGVLAAARALGLKVPRDLRLVTFVDSEHTRSADPPISAADLPMEKLGVRAVQLLLARLRGDDPPPVPELLRPAIHWRASSA